MVRHRVRIRFRKEGDLRLIGHHDLARAWERAFRRAQIPLRMSEGFHPKPKMVFASALTMGAVGADEVLDVELAEARSADDLVSSLAPRLPESLRINSLELLPDDAPRSRVDGLTYEVPVPADRHAAVALRLRNALAPQGDSGGEPSIPDTCGRDPLAFVDEIELTDGVLRFTARVTPEGTTRPRELLAWLGLADLDEQGLYLTRTKVEMAT